MREKIGFYLLVFLASFQLYGRHPEGYIEGIKHTSPKIATESSASIMKRALIHMHDERQVQPRLKRVRIDEERPRKKRNVHSPFVSHYPFRRKEANRSIIHEDLRTPQAIGVNFTAASLNPQYILFPPDSMGAVGPTQFILAINGLIRSFNKINGTADGVLNVNPDVFFSSITNNSYTSDPRIRYDRFSGRWFLVMINVEDSNNRVLLAISDGSAITNATQWSFFYIPAGNGIFFDYPTLGIDRNALYIGGTTFSNTETAEVFVINKNSVLNGGPITYYTFHNLIDPVTGVGPYAVQAVDNFDTNSTDGYFAGVDNATFGTLVFRRIFNPGGTPSISPNIVVTVPVTRYPINPNHLGNSGGKAGRLEGMDDRLISAHVRNGSLWTVHGIGVNNAGVSSSVTRNGCRWYQLNMSTQTPQLVQAGTLYNKTSKNGTDALSYWMGSIMTNSRGQMALGCSVAGQNLHANAATVGRLASDSLGTLRSPVYLTNSLTAYNPSQDPGDPFGGRRWGDYSFTCVDPVDDLTMWTVQEFCSNTNVWGVRVSQLLPV